MWFNYLILLTIVRVCKGTVSSSESFGWLWKEPVCYCRYSKWCPFAFTHARSCTRHWSIASSMTPWYRLDQVSMRRCFSWLTSVNSTSVSEVLKQPVDATFCPSFVRKFCKQPASIVSLRQMQTFDQYFVFVAERHCLQILQWRVNDVISAYQIYS